jgi:hypothetical protein
MPDHDLRHQLKDQVLLAPVQEKADAPIVIPQYQDGQPIDSERKLPGYVLQHKNGDMVDGKLNAGVSAIAVEDVRTHSKDALVQDPLPGEIQGIGQVADQLFSKDVGIGAAIEERFQERHAIVQAILSHSLPNNTVTSNNGTGTEVIIISHEANGIDADNNKTSVMALKNHDVVVEAGVDLPADNKVGSYIDTEHKDLVLRDANSEMETKQQVIDMLDRFSTTPFIKLEAAPELHMRDFEDNQRQLNTDVMSSERTDTNTVHQQGGDTKHVATRQAIPNEGDDAQLAVEGSQQARN